MVICCVCLCYGWIYCFICFRLVFIISLRGLGLLRAGCCWYFLFGLVVIAAGFVVLIFVCLFVILFGRLVGLFCPLVCCELCLVWWLGWFAAAY